MDEALRKIYTNNLSTNTDFLNDVTTLTENYISIQKSSQKVYKQQTSFALGEQGQQNIIATLQSVFGVKFVTDISKVSHQGDILIEYMHKNIMVEVKNKQIITPTDIQKFKDDSTQYDFSIFISLLTPTMQEYKGFSCIGEKLLYLSAPYVSHETFTLIKIFLTKLFTTPSSSDIEATANNMKLVRAFHSKLQWLQDTLTQIHKKHQELQQLESQLQGFSQYFSTMLTTADESAVILQQEDELKKYAQTINKSQLRKSYITQQWPALQLDRYTLQQIIQKYCLKFIE